MCKVGLVIPTLNAGHGMRKLLENIFSQTFVPDIILVVDSGSTDQTLAIAMQYNVQVVRITRNSFNHGGTRQQAVELLGSKVQIILFITQDVVLSDNNSFKYLVNGFANEGVGAAYGRQCPFHDASLFSKQLRLFNYPKRSNIKSYEDKTALGIKTPFISDSFAAYRVDALNKIGGFPLNVIVAEDMFVGAKILMCGLKIAYIAEAQVYHSHEYTLVQDFRRYFDTGVFHSREAWIKENFGQADREGIKFVQFQFKYFFKKKNLMGVTQVFLQNSIKFLAYRLGMMEKWLPVAIKRKLSAQKSFWHAS